MQYYGYSFAKINLHLDVLNLENTGFHNLFSIFVPIDWYDTLMIQESHKYLFQSNNAWLNEQDMLDLTFGKVISVLKPYAKYYKPFHLILWKKVPYQAGLGIASSNAVTLMKLLNHFWKCQLSTRELSKLSVSIGSDCPFFFHNQICMVEGRGEKITPLSYKPLLYPLWIIKPKNISINTSQAYKKVASKNYYNQYQLIPKQVEQAIKPEVSFELLKAIAKNSFYDILSQDIVELRQIFDTFSNQNTIVQMSGSGSSFYIIFKDKNIAQEYYKKNIHFLQNNFDFFASML